jgi:hypothetical protein
LKDPFCIDIETGDGDNDKSSADLYIVATFIDNDNGNGPVLEVIIFFLKDHSIKVLLDKYAKKQANYMQEMISMST